MHIRRWYSISSQITDIVIWYHKLWRSVKSYSICYFEGQLFCRYVDNHNWGLLAKNRYILKS